MFDIPDLTLALRSCRNAGIGPSRKPGHSGRLAIAAILLLLPLSGCLFKGKKGQESRYPTAPIRITLLPLNAVQDNADLKQTALAALVIMAEVVERAPDLEAVPLWEVMPVAMESLRTSRNITPEIAAYVATRMTARWATQGQILPSEKGISMTIDFIPARSTFFPFRFENEDTRESLARNLDIAFKQFTDYLIARPIADRGKDRFDLNSNKLALAIDREYGWFVEADPGKAGEAVAELMQSKRNLARFLFNPSLYPKIDEGREAPPSQVPPPQ